MIPDASVNRVILSWSDAFGTSVGRACQIIRPEVEGLPQRKSVYSWVVTAALLFLSG